MSIATYCTILISKRAGNHGKGAGGSVTDVLVRVVDVRPHGGNHVWKSGLFGEVGYDLAAFDVGVVVLVNEEGVDVGEYAVNVG